MDNEPLYWTCPYCGANLDIDEKCDCGHNIDNYTSVQIKNNKGGIYNVSRNDT